MGNDRFTVVYHKQFDRAMEAPAPLLLRPQLIDLNDPAAPPPKLPAPAPPVRARPLPSTRAARAQCEADLARSAAEAASAARKCDGAPSKATAEESNAAIERARSEPHRPHLLPMAARETTPVLAWDVPFLLSSIPKSCRVMAYDDALSGRGEKSYRCVPFREILRGGGEAGCKSAVAPSPYVTPITDSQPASLDVLYHGEFPLDCGREINLWEHARKLPLWNCRRGAIRMFFWTCKAKRVTSLHHDDYDQVTYHVGVGKGTKTWKIWTPGAVASAAEPMTVVLRAGDALYVPRGWPHAVVTQGACMALSVAVDSKEMQEGKGSSPPPPLRGGPRLCISGPAIANDSEGSALRAIFAVEERQWAEGVVLQNVTLHWWFDRDECIGPQHAEFAEAWCWPKREPRRAPGPADGLDNGGLGSLCIPSSILRRGAGACRFVAEAWLEQGGLQEGDAWFRRRGAGEYWGALLRHEGHEQIPRDARVLRRVASAVWDNSDDVQWTSPTPQVRRHLSR